MKLNQVVVKVISAASALGLETAVNGFLATVGEATLVATHYTANEGIYSAMIVYTN